MCIRDRKYGVPDSVYFDNGKQYRTKWMARTCSKLGIRLLYAKPYSPEATGKVEKFNQTVDSFLREAALSKPQTLDHFNQLFNVWLEECYQNKPHSALENKLSPTAAYQRDRKALKFLDQETVANAFLHCEERKVDKSGCISFEGRKYEVGLNLIGCTAVSYTHLDVYKRQSLIHVRLDNCLICHFKPLFEFDASNALFGSLLAFLSLVCFCLALISNSFSNTILR